MDCQPIGYDWKLTTHQRWADQAHQPQSTDGKAKVQRSPRSQTLHRAGPDENQCQKSLLRKHLGHRQQGRQPHPRKGGAGAPISAGGPWEGSARSGIMLSKIYNDKSTNGHSICPRPLQRVIKCLCCVRNTSRFLLARCNNPWQVESDI